jgi:negative regulator of sigma E activity
MHMPDLEKTAQELTDSLRAVALGLVEVGRWRRRFTLSAAAAGVCFAVALGLGGWAIAAVTAAQHDACISTNQARAGNVKLWDHVLKVSAGTQQTAAQRARLQGFRTYVHQVYKQRDCG